MSTHIVQPMPCAFQVTGWACPRGSTKQSRFERWPSRAPTEARYVPQYVWMSGREFIDGFDHLSGADESAFGERGKSDCQEARRGRRALDDVRRVAPLGPHQRTNKSRHHDGGGEECEAHWSWHAPPPRRLSVPFRHW